MRRRLTRPDWRDWPLSAVAFSGVTRDRLRDSGFTTMRQLDALTAAERRDRIAGLTDGQFDRITSILAELHDDEVVFRCQPFGEHACSVA